MNNLNVKKLLEQDVNRWKKKWKRVELQIKPKVDS